MTQHYRGVVRSIVRARVHVRTYVPGTLCTGIRVQITLSPRRLEVSKYKHTHGTRVPIGKVPILVHVRYVHVSVPWYTSTRVPMMLEYSYILQ